MKGGMMKSWAKFAVKVLYESAIAQRTAALEAALKSMHDADATARHTSSESARCESGTKPEVSAAPELLKRACAGAAVMNDTLAATPSIAPDLSDATQLARGTVGSLGRPPEGGAGDQEITNIHTRWAEVALKVLEQAAIIQDTVVVNVALKQARPMPGHRNMGADIDPSDTSCNSTERLHSDSDSA